MLVKFLLLVIKFYQKAISPLVPARCRFYPTCSVYGIHALKWHGVRGIPLVIRRILRCQPWGGSGVDFVPLPLACYRYVHCDDTALVRFANMGVYKDRTSYLAVRNQMMK